MLVCHRYRCTIQLQRRQAGKSHSLCQFGFFQGNLGCWQHQQPSLWAGRLHCRPNTLGSSRTHPHTCKEHRENGSCCEGFPSPRSENYMVFKLQVLSLLTEGTHRAGTQQPCTEWQCNTDVANIPLGAFP